MPFFGSLLNEALACVFRPSSPFRVSSHGFDPYRAACSLLQACFNRPKTPKMSEIAVNPENPAGNVRHFRVFRPFSGILEGSDRSTNRWIFRDVVQLLTNSGRRSCTDPISRLAGLDLLGLLQRVMERGIEKRDIFLYDADREYFIQESSLSILDRGREREAGLGEAGAIRNVAGLSLSAHPPA